MKKLYSIAAIIVLLTCGNSFGQKKIKEYKGPLIGKWETPDLGMDASHLTIEFKTKYRFSYDLKSIWNGSYKLDGTKLTSSYYIPFLNKWVRDTSIVLINADTLILASGKDSSQSAAKFIRLQDSLDIPSGIVGKWEAKKFQGENTIFTFQKDGNLSVQKTLNKYDGYFTVQKNIFSVFLNRQMVMKMKYQIIRGNLYLYKIGSAQVMKLVREK